MEVLYGADLSPMSLCVYACTEQRSSDDDVVVCRDGGGDGTSSGRRGVGAKEIPHSKSHFTRSRMDSRGDVCEGFLPVRTGLRITLLRVLLLLLGHDSKIKFELDLGLNDLMGLQRIKESKNQRIKNQRNCSHGLRLIRFQSCFQSVRLPQ